MPWTSTIGRAGSENKCLDTSRRRRTMAEQL
jgi:hypothetical protein